MKLRDILNIVDKSKHFKDSVDVSRMADVIGLPGYYNYEEQERFVSYFIGSWYCTDSYVGYKVYFFDDEPVAVSSQVGRKCSENFEWLSKDLFLKVKNYVMTFEIEGNENNIELANLDEEIGEGYKIHFNGQLFDYHKEIPLLNGENVKIIELKKEKNYFGTEKSVIIKMKDGSEKWIEVGELVFPYNTAK